MRAAINKGHVFDGLACTVCGLKLVSGLGPDGMPVTRPIRNGVKFPRIPGCDPSMKPTEQLDRRRR